MTSPETAVSTATDLVTTTLDVRSMLHYEVSEPTSFAFSVVAARTQHQFVLREDIDVTPAMPVEVVPYGEGGSHQLVRLDADPGPITLRYAATVGIAPRTDEPASIDEVPFRDVPADLMPYLNPSRYCESDRVSDLANRLFGEVPTGYGRVRAITGWVESEIEYVPGSTDTSSGTAEVLLQRAGVCRDFAHVAISMCRALGIPARYVSVYGVGVTPPDFHGVFEAYLGGEWWLFDPTGMAPTDGLVRIGFGRDAADASFSTFVGDAELIDKEVSVNLIATTDATSTTQAIDRSEGDQPTAVANSTA